MGLDNDDIKALIAILQKGLVDDDIKQDTENTSNTKSTKKMNSIKTKKTKVKYDTNNRFLEMGFDRLHKEDIAIDKALSKNPPTPRTRKFATIKVQCRVCGKKESINPSLLYESPDRYKCNKCCSSPG